MDVQDTLLRKSDLTLLDFLKQEGLSPDLLDGIRAFNAQYPTPPRCV